MFVTKQDATIEGEQGREFNLPPSQGLYSSAYEHDACGVGFLANIDGSKSHDIVTRGIEVLENLMHRGATGADEGTGDGAGLLFQIPDRFFRKVVVSSEIELPADGLYGVGMVFLPQDEAMRCRCGEVVERVTAEEKVTFLGWRDVPVDPDVLGDEARERLPFIGQFFVTVEGSVGDELERRLYILRRQIENAIHADVTDDSEEFYVLSLSSRTIVYKGLMLAPQVAGFYLDLADPDLESAVAVVHQRYSTNTFPSWSLAQPFRYLAHNGEINTLRGNLNWMRSRSHNMQSDVFGDDISKLFPIIDERGSDSGCLDNAFELLVNAGRTPDHSMVMLIPQAWGAQYPMGPDLRGFFEYHAGIMEPWDGPAAVAFSDGRVVGGLLDRNGLRPARYTITKDGFVVFASEAGVLDIDPAMVEEKGALRPGEMLLIDLEKKRVLHDYEVKMRLARKQPYRRWVDENRISIHGFFNAAAPVNPDEGHLVDRQRLFGYTREDIRMILDPMASEGQEPVGSMGADEPLAILSEKPQLLYWYFKQLFAQVTNPPIDPIREQLVMSLMTYIGCADQILSETATHARLLKLQHPILSNDDMERVRTLRYGDYRSRTLPIGFPAGGTGNDLEAALVRLCEMAESAIRNGIRLLILSDKELPDGECPIPALLAVSAVNRHLVELGLRTSIGILLETGEAREVMHIAVLLGYGASAVNPYLAYDIIAHMVENDDLTKSLAVTDAIQNYSKALCKGLLKIMSKMGISTLRSYRSAQVFQAIGLDSGFLDRYFPGTVSQIEGIGLEGIAREAGERYRNAMRGARGRSDVLDPGGHYKVMVDGERHLWNADSIRLVQTATRTGDKEMYREYARLINEQTKAQSTLRGLFQFKKGTPIPLDEVELASEITKRFVSGAMSFGSISKEAHETLAIAMNRIGGMSNSGEGGEDPVRFTPLPNGDDRCSAIKQIASGRFGVTAEYLVHARDLQIKIAQGAKPGEGGQLPGYKVVGDIARVRHAIPGVSLISPPPHHDIYSIEDIAQLIFDLKCANRDARVSVKLVSEVGVGTVAAGVAKARADMILIAGFDGGTGASPLSSLRHAGAPWELGLAETQQTLVRNGLRSRVRLQTDGQIKTGRDVVIAALLGAEEYGFATTALVMMGCVMMRVCHKNTCPVGVATQDPELRKRFTGKPEYVVNFFNFIAEEARELMAELGFRSIDEMVGRTDMLEVNDAIDFWKTRNLDLSRILFQEDASSEGMRKAGEQDHGVEKTLDFSLLRKVMPALENATPVTIDLNVRNVDRTIGAMISGEIAKRYGNEGLPHDTITLRLKGAVGQSFGAFCAKGMTLELDGEANDYVGKGLSGGKIIVRPPENAGFDAASNVLAGNVLFYGATSGTAYINGRAGERFAIRNSGANIVVEGVGDHACEYMTGGRVVILGTTGVNFGAGMSGGLAYVYDEDGSFDNQCNLNMIDLELVESADDVRELREMIEAHRDHTGSAKAVHLLENWERALPRFVKVFPMEYKRALGRMSREDAETEREEVVNN